MDYQMLDQMGFFRESQIERKEEIKLLNLSRYFGHEGYRDTIDFVNKEELSKYKNNGVKISTTYSDRLYSWDSKKYDDSCKKVWNNVGQFFRQRCENPEKIQEFLSLYFDKKCELLAVVTTENRNTGYPVSCFYYVETE